MAKGQLFQKLSSRIYHFFLASLYIIIIIMSFEQILSFIGAKPSFAATISGRVLSKAENNPIQGMEVMIAEIYSDFYSSEFTDSTGGYEFNGLPSGVYILCVNTAQSEYVAEFFNDAPDYSLAENIELSEEQVVPDVDFTLSSGRSISGRVTRLDDGTPISGIMIGAAGVENQPITGYISPIGDIQSYAALIFGLGKNRNFALTDSNGDYHICGLSPGRYQVGTISEPMAYTPYIPKWYEDEAGPLTAALVPLGSDSDVSGIDLTLSEGGSVAGIITDPNDSPVKGICIAAIPSSGAYYTGSGYGLYTPPAYSDPNGRYIIGGMKPGNYIIQADSASVYGYQNSYYAQVQQVTVQSGVLTDQIDFVICKKEGGRISGRITDLEDGKPIQGISLSAMPASPYYYPSSCCMPVPSGPNGYFTFGGLEKGSYVIQVVPQPFPLLRSDLNKYILGEYYDGVFDYYRATPFLITDQEEVTGIDFGIAVGGSISGRIIRETDHSPVAGIYVAAVPCPVSQTYASYAPITYYSNSIGISDHEGRYSIKGLQSGSYQIFFNDPGPAYMPFYPSPMNQYLSGMYHAGECIMVSAPFDNPNIDISLEVGASISGTVTDTETGSPLSGIQVQAEMINPEGNGTVMSGYAQYGGFDPSGQFISNTRVSADTDIFGNYTILGLPADEYQVVACDKRGRYCCSTYQVIRTEAGQDVTDIDFSLKMGGTISGTVIDESTGLPIADIQVKAVDMNYNIFDPFPMYESVVQTVSSPLELNFINSDSTDQTGKFTITGLLPGTYRVIATDSQNIYLPGLPEDIYLPEYFDNIPMENQDGVFYTELSRELDITDPPDPVLEFKVRGDSEFRLILDIGEDTGGSISIVFQSGGNNKNQILNPYLGVDGSIIVPFSTYIKDWEVHDEELNDLLEKFKPGVAVNSIDKITLKGNSYWIDYIKLTGLNASEFMEAFDYQDLPTNHGWENIHPQSTYLAMVEDLDSEDGVLRVTSGQAVVLTDSMDTITDCDFVLSKAGTISGRVSDSTTGDPLEGIEVIACDYDRSESIAASFTDHDGNYRISGLAPGDYFLLARDPGLEYLDQYYDRIENPYTGHVVDSMSGYYDDNHHFRSIIKKEIPSIQYNNHILEFKLKTNGPFCLGITLKTTASKTVRIDVIPERWKSCTVLDDIIQSIQVPVEGEYNQGIWNYYQVDLNDLLLTRKGLSMDYVKEITIKGDDYLLDYINLTEDYKTDQYIDHFDYSDSPFDHGWSNLGAKTSHIETITDQETGLHVLRVLPYHLLSLSASQDLNNRDFSIIRAACLCGKVMGDPNQDPVAGIELIALSEGRGLTSYAVPGYDYGLQTSFRTNNMGEYCIKGLFPGEYRVMAKDPLGYYNNSFYGDMPIEPDSYSPYILSYTDVVNFDLPNRFYTRIYQDLSDREFDNAEFSFQAIYRDMMNVSVEVETVTGRNVTIVMICGSLVDDDSKFLDPNTHILASTHSPGYTYGGYNYGESGGGYYSIPFPGATWFKTTQNLNGLLINNYYSSMGELEKIKGVSISGNDYRIDFIKFVEDGKADEVVDEFDYADANDLPTDHGWTNVYPDTTNLAMIEDRELDRRVLAVSAAKTVCLSQGEIKDHLDIRLTHGARIEGRIAAADGGAPLANIVIEAKEFDPSFGIILGPPSYSSASDSSGRYTLSLPCYEGESKEYQLTARDYMEIYADIVYSESISVTSGTIITGIDMSMSLACSVSGQVTTLYDGRPMSHVLVQARTANECYPACLDCDDVSNECCPPPYEGCMQYKVVKSTYTNSEGGYTLKNLPPGGYIIRARSSYMSTQEIIGFYDENSDYLDPSIILTPGQGLTSIDIQLSWNPYIFSSCYSAPTGNYYGYGGSYGGSPYTQSLSSPVSSGSSAGTAPQSYAFFAPNVSNPPVITSTPETTAIVDELYTYQVTLKDPNSLNNDAILQLTRSPDGMQLDPNSGLITWIPNVTQAGSQEITVGVNSSRRGISRQEFIIHVLDHKAMGPCEGEYAASEWVIEYGSGTLDCVWDQTLKKDVLEALTSEDNPLDFQGRFPAGEMPPQSATPKRYLSFSISDMDIFRFKVNVQADGIDYTIIYSSTDGDISTGGNTIHYPLGSIYRDGDWHVINRDLQTDIDPLGAAFEYVKYFQIQGDYRLYDLKLGIEPFTDELIYLDIIPGLNLIGLSADMVRELTNSVRLVDHLGGPVYMNRLSRYNTYLKSWQVQSSDSGIAEFEIKDYQGYCLYAKEHLKVAIKKDDSTFDIQELAKRMRPGLNLVHISKLPGYPYHATDLIKELEDSADIKVISIRKFRSKEGSWRGVYGFFNRPNKSDFQLRTGEGYVIHIHP
ncbi:MAG: carboxypeptidase regulatory-like domain-containing protein [bacterium]